MKVVSVHENEILPKLEYFCENFQENKEVSDFRENVNVWAVSRNEISLFRANGILYPLQIMQWLPRIGLLIPPWLFVGAWTK